MVNVSDREISIALARCQDLELLQPSRSYVDSFKDVVEVPILTSTSPTLSTFAIHPFTSSPHLISSVLVCKHLIFTRALCAISNGNV